MSQMRSPGAVIAARGASETDDLWRGVVPEPNHRSSFAQPPIYAKLVGADHCSTLGLTARGSSPLFTLCRKLIAAGVEPSRPLHCYRSGALALVVHQIGLGAKLTVRSAGNGCPIVAREDGCGGAGRPSVRQNLKPRS